MFKKDYELRSPICCVLGHVDTGKTKLLDKMRSSSVQDNEVGGITQQIGASFFPIDFITKVTEQLEASQKKQMEYLLPGLLVIDTPGHESFSNLRKRGSSLCDIAVLVVDIMHGVEPQTEESIRLLKAKKTPFIIALNKIDKIYEWKPHNGEPFVLSIEKQGKDQKTEFRRRLKDSVVQINSLGLNCALYSENEDVRSYISIVPTSAHTGEGIPDLLRLLVSLTQTRLRRNLRLRPQTECSVLEVRQDEGLGFTADLILSNGFLSVGDRILLSGLNGPIETAVRGMYQPAPLKETRFKGEFRPVKTAKAAAGLKISAPDLEKAVAGSSVLVVRPGDDVETLKREVMTVFADLFEKVNSSKPGVYVQSSTLGALEAFLEYLQVEKVPVNKLSIGPVRKKDVMTASVMLDRRAEYAVILAFNVKVDKEAQLLADSLGVKIFQGEIIYNLRDMFVEYLEGQKKKMQEADKKVVIPVLLSVIPEHIIMQHNPIILGCKVEAGRLQVGTPLVAVRTERQLAVARAKGDNKKHICLGVVESVELDKKKILEAKLNSEVAVKIVPSANEANICYGKHFNSQNKICSLLTRRSIDILKEDYRDDLSKEEWKLVIQLKKVFGIL